MKKQKSKIKKMSIEDLAVLMKKGFDRVDKKFERQDEKFATKEDVRGVLVAMEQMEENILGVFRDESKSRDYKVSDLEVRVTKIEEKVF